MSFFVKAAVHALKKYPVLNASVDGNDIVYHGYFDIGIASARRAAWWCPSCAMPTR
jgi:pyruvate/2-oxoglutarate dehydrogenase complex dihydrolipoamide acyltransferase (E2) component